MGYATFARYYDSLIAGVSYGERADYLFSIFGRLGHQPGLTLDLACGTGSLTLELARRGVDVVGLDASADMLTLAQQKLSAAGYSVLLLNQRMEELELCGPVDTVVSSLDSVNHLETQQQVSETFRRVSACLNPGGCFVFDANTVYKHREILGSHTFVYDLGSLFCVWQNAFEAKTNRVAVSLDFFERFGSAYERSSERFYERAYDSKTLCSLLERAGLHVAGVWADQSFLPPSDKTDRMVIAAVK
ncbi:class I SAM-dependent DNA methyltransferase [Caproicibacter sp.]|uniref:class I SAM-dependent DNA methyltransferase n=1 Tax=Caproicibacter sp. TaxID=2814884 RepID=UPI003989389E